MVRESFDFRHGRNRMDDRTDREKCLLLSLILFILISVTLLALVLYFALKPKDTEDGPGYKTCNTRDCVLTASHLIDSMDRSVNPCDDFFKFACGNFIKKHIVPEDSDLLQINSSSIFAGNFDLHKKSVMEDPTGKEPEIVVKVQTAYHSCLNVGFQKKKELSHFKKYVKQILDWPMATGKNWRPKRIEDMMTTWIKNDIDIFTVNVISGDPVELLISYSNPVELVEFANQFNRHEKEAPRLWFLKEVLMQLGVSDISFLEQDLKDSRTFMNYYEKNMKYLFSDSKQMTVANLNALTDNKINWLSIINAKLKEEEKINLDSNVTLNNADRFNFILNQLEQPRTLANIVGWMEISNLLHEFGPMFGKSYQRFQKMSNETKTPRWKHCLQWVEGTYPLVFTRAYIDRYVDKDTKKIAAMMMNYVLKGYEEMIMESSWLSQVLKDASVKKVQKTIRMIAYPDDILVDEKLEKIYTHIPDLQPTYFENYMAIKTIHSPEITEEDMKSSDIFAWMLEYPLQINAFYNIMQGAMWFPVGIMQLPFFDSNRIESVNFGSMGSVIGHEMGHDFDPTGRNDDANNPDAPPWPQDMTNIFDNKGLCFAEQYNNFCPEELQFDNQTRKEGCVNGNFTLGENEADFTGQNAAFRGYKLWVREHGPDKRLPGLEEYTPEKLFFLGYANVWCENTPIYNWNEIYDNADHSPAMYRIIGTMSNSKYFRETFQCPEGRMNRGEKSCSIW